MRKRVTQNQFRTLHSCRQDLIELCTRPDVVQRFPLNFCIRAALCNAASDDDASTRFGGLRDEVVVLRSQARVWDLESVEDSQLDERRQFR